jgi:hypothetical protein
MKCVTCFPYWRVIVRGVSGTCYRVLTQEHRPRIGEEEVSKEKAGRHA